LGWNKKGWYERQEISKVTLDWLKSNVNPTEREMELLQIIQQRKLVSRDHLEILSPSYRDVGKSRTRVINRALRRLYDGMCIDKVHEKQEMGKGNKPFIIALDRGGSILLRIPHKRRIPIRKEVVRGQERIFRSVPSFFRHVNGINQLEVDTILFCIEHGFEIIRWEHEIPREFHYDDKVVVIPDVTASIRFGDKTLNTYIEYDTGSENIRHKDRFPLILEKIVKYRKYKISRLWEDESPYFPVVLFVTEDERRIPYFNEKCEENKIRGVGVYHENYIEVLSHLARMS